MGTTLMGVIATAAKFLIAAGMTGDELVEALEEIENAGIPTIDARAIKRAYDREYHKTKREHRTTSYDIIEERKVSPDPSKETTTTSSVEETSEVHVREVFPTRKDLDEAVSEWNDLAEMRGLAKVLGLNVKRRKALTARLRELGSIDEWVEVLVKVRDSPFCCGETTGFRATFDFVLQPSSMIKIREGNYDGTTQGQDRNRPRNYG